MDWTDFILGLFLFSEKAFARTAVVSFVFALVYVPCLIKRVKEFSDAAFVQFARRAQENVMRYIQPFPKLCERRRDLIAVSLWRDVFLISNFLDIFPMLIHAGQKKNLVPFETMVSCVAHRRRLLYTRVRRAARRWYSISVL